MGIVSDIRKFLWRKRKIEQRRERKLKILDFIENNSSKSDFIHWLLNNTEGLAFSEEDSWPKIKREISENSDISYALLRGYAITLKKEKITEEALEEMIEETEEAEEVARKLTFLGRFKKFSIGIGGALLFLGVIKIIGAVILVLESSALFPAVSLNLKFALASLIGVAGIIEFLGGIFLIAM